MDDLRAAFGQRVKGLREALRLSQAGLAERAGLDSTYVSGIERGRRNPGLNSLQRLAVALETRLPDLLGDLRPDAAAEIRRGRPRKR